MSDNRSRQELIHQIVQKIVAGCGPEKIILFGSSVCGAPRPQSDLDVLVIMDTTLPPRERSVRLRQAIGPVGIPLDLFVLTPDEYQETKDVIGGIAYAPAKYGRIVYEKS